MLVVFGYSPMSNILVGARAQLKPKERLAYHSFRHSFTQKYALSINFVPVLNTVINKTDRLSVLSEFHFSLESRQQVKE